MWCGSSPPSTASAARPPAGEEIESGRDEATGLPVVSLYGDHRKPRPEDLKDLDALVFDLQDAGVRFYTYVSTLILALEAAAEAGIEFVVLDRPNPLGGERIEGPMSAPVIVVPASFLNLAPGPLVHGLTLGEMATLRQRAPRETGPPHGRPDGRLEAAHDLGRHRPALGATVAQPAQRRGRARLSRHGSSGSHQRLRGPGNGIALPAPRRALARLSLSPSPCRAFAWTQPQFTPRTAKYTDQECRGLSVHVTDPATAEPYRLGVTLLAVLSRQPGFEWRDDRDKGDALTRLVGTRRLVEDLKAGKTVEEILAAGAAAHDAWRRERQAALIYPE